MNLHYTAYADLPKGSFLVAAIQVALAILLALPCWAIGLAFTSRSSGAAISALPSYLLTRARLNYRMGRVKALHRQWSDCRIEITTMGALAPAHLHARCAGIEQRAAVASTRAYELILQECPHVLGPEEVQAFEEGHLPPTLH
jgi:hypothetical protein